MYTSVQGGDMGTSPSGKANQGHGWDKYDDLYKNLTESQRQRDELKNELRRLEDSKSLFQIKNSALSGSSSPQGGQPASTAGFKLLHILIVAIMSLILGGITSRLR
jgi:hypothetical protein